MRTNIVLTSLSGKGFPMRVNLVRIGNSRGVIIPAALLAACQLGDEVNLQVEAGKITIEALRQPRSHWFDSYRPDAEEAELDAIPQDESDSEWTW